METSYPKVLSTWENITMELGILRLKFKYKKEEKQQMHDCDPMSSPSEILDNEIDDLDKQIALMSNQESKAQICLSEAVFSDASIQNIRQNSRMQMKKLENALDMLDQRKKKAAFGEYEVRNMNLEMEIANILLEKTITSKIVNFSNSLALERDEKSHSVALQWIFAVRKKDYLLAEIKSWRLKKKDLQVLQLNERQQREKFIDEKLKILEMDLEKKAITIRAFGSMLSTLLPSMFKDDENESCHEENKKEKPTDHPITPINESESVIDTEKKNDEKKLNVVKLKGENQIKVDSSLGDTLNKYDNAKTAHRSDNEEYKDDKPEDKLTEIIYKRENENISDKDTVDKTVSGVEEDPENGQNHHNKTKSDDERYGLIIESIYQKDVSYKSEPWKADERLGIIKGKVFPDGFKLETDIFYIKETTAGTTRHKNKESVKSVLIKVPFSKENSSYYEYKGAVKFGQKWKIIDYTLQDGYMVFEVDQGESFCVISMEYQEKHTVLPLGSQFVSGRDNRIKVIFPPDAVSTEKEITFKIHPVDIKCILERSADQDNEFSNICMITPGLSTTHVEFKKMFKVQLPIHLISNSYQNTEDYKFEIFKWNDTGAFELTDLDPTVNNGLAVFETNSFCGYVCVATPKLQSTSSIENILQEAYGLKKWCKILFFVGKKGHRNLPIMLECVALHRVKEVIKKRTEYGFSVVSEWIGKDFLFIPDKTIITVDVTGDFKVPKESKVKHPKLSFIPIARENFTRFLVETSGTLYGVLSIRDRKGVLDEIFYNPASSKNLPLNMTIRNELMGNRNKQMMISRTSTTRNPKGRGSAKKAVSEQKDDFFSEKGLLALSKLLSPDKMFEVCINMDMTTSTYETIQQKHVISTLGNIELLQDALNQHPHNKQLENLIKALIAAGQKALADKVELLHSTGKDLHTI